MTDQPTSRSALLELVDERAAMREGYGFLDEKCLLLAGGILKELARHAELWPRLLAARAAARATWVAAAARHGLEELAGLPLAASPPAAAEIRHEGLMGVKLAVIDAHCTPAGSADPLLRSPEAAACADACAALLPLAAALAGCEGNLQRLLDEYRRTARRARAIDGVLLPEIDAAARAMAAALEELDQDDAIAMRPRVR